MCWEMLPVALCKFEASIIGTREQCQQRVLDYARGGIHTHVVSCLGFEPAVVDATYRACAPEHFGFRGL